MIFRACVILLLAARVLAAPPCPDTAAGETDRDCPWAAVARELSRVAESGGRLEPVLAARLPDLTNQLARDSRLDRWKALWGLCTNRDGGGSGVIVDPRILAVLLAQAGLPPMAGDTLHAGVQHTYGYLFSNLKTRFGYKRLRWVSGELEKGFGLPSGLLSPAPAQGSLFANVTYFAGSIAFRNDPALLAQLADSAVAVPETLSRFPFGQLAPRRLVETLHLDGNRIVELRTDFVGFSHPGGGGDAFLLVYSVLDSQVGTPRLITAFPVSADFLQMALAPGGLGDHKPIVSRYNAMVAGVTGVSGLSGSRRIAVETARDRSR